MTDDLDRWIAERSDGHTEELRELCAIPSEATDPAALDRAAAWCLERMRAAGRDTREVRIGGVPAIAVGEAGQGKRALIAVQRYDVQPAVPLELKGRPMTSRMITGRSL